jgi:putative colanic acid biosynthesis UDP-glucose lipid carrier transferase
MALQTRYDYIIGYIMPITDVIILNALYLIPHYCINQLTGGFSAETSKNYLVICNLIWMLSTTMLGLYSVNGIQKSKQIYILTLKCIVLHGAMFGAYILFFETKHFSIPFLSLFYSFFTVVFFISRWLGTTLYNIFVGKDKAGKRVAILGSNRTAQKFSSFLSHQRNLDFIGSLGNDDSIYAGESGVLSTGIGKIFSDAVRFGVTDVYVAVAPGRMAEVSALINEADRNCVRLKLIPDLGSSLIAPYRMDYIGNEFPVITLRNEPLEDLKHRFIKRIFDIVFSGLVILLVFSWLFPILAVLIKLSSRGPVFFKQLRSGRNDRPFMCYKFRTMEVNIDADTKQATKGDARITRIGSYLRRTSLDELPQFFNVLIGDMSVVGPRPHMLKHTAEYKAIVNQFMVRHFLKPGITGWAQVNGFRGETRHQKDMEDRVKCDIYYLENWTAMFDVKIILKTIVNIADGEKNAF